MQTVGRTVSCGLKKLTPYSIIIVSIFPAAIYLKSFNVETLVLITACKNMQDFVFCFSEQTVPRLLRRGKKTKTLNALHVIKDIS